MSIKKEAVNYVYPASSDGPNFLNTADIGTVFEKRCIKEGDRVILEVNYYGPAENPYVEIDWETKTPQQDFFDQVNRLLVELRSKKMPPIKGQENMYYWQIGTTNQLIDLKVPLDPVSESLRALKEQHPEAKKSGLLLQTPYGGFSHFTENNGGITVMRAGIESVGLSSRLVAKFINQSLTAPLPEEAIRRQINPQPPKQIIKF